MLTSHSRGTQIPQTEIDGSISTVVQIRRADRSAENLGFEVVGDLVVLLPVAQQSWYFLQNHISECGTQIRNSEDVTKMQRWSGLSICIRPEKSIHAKYI